MNKFKISPEIHFAPLQGVTDAVYRSVFNRVISHVDYYYTPYLSLENNGSIKLINDINLIENKLRKITIPQVLPSSIEELKALTKPIFDLDFKSININLGCPYPMVTRKGRGSALIRKAEVVSDFIAYIADQSDLDISLKVRSGLEESSEIFNLFDQIPLDKLKYIIVHPRTAKQLYKGNASPDVFLKCLKLFPEIELIYNGDIEGIADFNSKSDLMPKQQKWMIGRGLTKDPFLAWKIKNATEFYPDGYSSILNQFILALFDAIVSDSKDNGHALNRLKHQLKILLSDVKYKKIAKKIGKVLSLGDLKTMLYEYHF